MRGASVRVLQEGLFTLGLLLVGTSARAQEPPSPGAPGPGAAPVQAPPAAPPLTAAPQPPGPPMPPPVASTPAIPATAPPPAAPAPAPPRPTPPRPPSDHERVIHKLAVGYLGPMVSNTGLGLGIAGAVGETTVDPVVHLRFFAPIVGVRYWMSTRVGIDAGLGVGYSFNDGTTVNGEGESVDSGQGILGGALHLGLPLALAHGGHYKMLLVPEVNLGLAKGDEWPSGQNRSAFLAQLGARLGAEIHFGFMGLPQLSMQTGVGLLATYTAWRRYPDPESPTPAEKGGTTWDIASTVGSSPWQFLNGNLAAFYYFP